MITVMHNIPQNHHHHQLWFYLVTITLCSATVIEALKCRVADDKIQQDFNDVVRTCMSNIHGMTKHNESGIGSGRQDNRYHSNHRGSGNSYSNRKPYNRGNYQQNNKKESYDEDEDDDSDETSYSTRNNGGNGNRYNNNRNIGFRNPFDQQGGRRPNRTSLSNGHNNKHVTPSPLEDIEPLDGDSKPDKSSVISVMTQKIRNPELKEFIQDSIMDCFEIIESGMRVDLKCEFSKQFALCLEEKGQQNCEDWDDDDNNNKKNNKQQSNNNKNNQNMKQNNNPFRG